MPLTPAFQLECLTALSRAIADLGACLEQTTTAANVAILQDQLASCHEHLCELMNDAAKRYEEVTRR